MSTSTDTATAARDELRLVPVQEIQVEEGANPRRRFDQAALQELADSIAQHGVIQDDGQEICNRKECVAKKEDLLVHLAYKAAVAERNATRHCGIETCGAQAKGECIRCGGFFCDRHVENRVEKVIENKIALQRVASLCEHCYKRRTIWLKM
mgnify:CR=1 FL=1